MTFTFNAQVREKVGKGAARATRRANLTPATIYGDNKDPMSISLDPKELASQLHKLSLYTNIYKVNINNKDQEVLIRNVQYHPVKDTPIHVDMLRIGEKTITRIEVPIIFHNQDKSQGLKFGGILNITTHTLEVACNPKIAPKQIDIDLADTRVGTVIKIEDIQLPKDVKTYYPKGFAIASITGAAAEEKPGGES